MAFVAIGERPAGAAGGPQAVSATIVNTSANPVPVSGSVSVANAAPILVRDVNQPNRRHWQKRVNMTLSVSEPR